MTLEQTILEILRLIGLPGALMITLAGVMYLRSRANLVEATAQASIAKDNAETVRRIAQKGDEDTAVLMKYVLEGQQQVVELTQMVGQVRLDLTEKINQIRIQNAELQVEVTVRRESETFLRESVVTELKELRHDIKEILENERDTTATSEIPEITEAESSSEEQDSEPEVDNNKRSDQSSSEVSSVGGGSITG